MYCSCCCLRGSQPITQPMLPPITQPMLPPITQPITSPITSPITQPITEYQVVTDLKEDCAICLEPLTAGDRIAILGCGHMFHGPCIYTWLFRKKVCPYCEKTVTL